MSSLFSIAEAYLGKGEYENFRNSIDESYFIAVDLEQQDMQLQLLYLYYEFYIKIGDQIIALDYLEKFVRLKQEVDEAIRTEQILEMQARFDTDKKDSELLEKEDEIVLLEQEKEIQDLQISQDRLLKLFLLISVVLVIVIAFTLYKRYRLRTRLNDILSEKNIELEEANATKNKFFSIISHDLSNYASVIESLSGMVERKHTMMDARMLSNNLKTLNDSAIHNKLLIRNLLEWAIAQSRRIKLIPQFYNASELCHSVVTTLENIASEKSISLIVHLDNDFKFYADRSTIETVLRNLISNAIKFSSDNSEIHIIAKANDDIAKFKVRDFGIGIEEDDLLKLFRVDVNPNTIGDNVNKGTGFGLILCKEFVEMNKGNIYVESEFGKGTDFIFKLPVKTEKDEKD